MCRPLHVRVWKKEHQQWESTGRSCGKAQLTRSIFPSAVKMKSARTYSIVQSGRAGNSEAFHNSLRDEFTSGSVWALGDGERDAMENIRLRKSSGWKPLVSQWVSALRSSEASPLGKSHLWHWWSHLWRCMKEKEAADLRRNHADIIPGYQTSVVSVWVKNGPSCCASVFTNVSSHAHYRSKLLHKRGPGLRSETDVTQHGFRAADVMFLNKKINVEELCCHATRHN